LTFTKLNPRLLRGATLLLLIAAFSIGVRHDFIHQAYTDYKYQDFVTRYYAAKPGQIVRTRINPGLFWEIGVKKN
jgi:hypothetical protein